MISNIGGSLTPIGDPPLFLGFLKGVPFFWTLEHNWPAWVLALGLLAMVFYWIDKRFAAAVKANEVETTSYSNNISIVGKRNFFWLLLIILSVFLDPNVMSWVPSIKYDCLEQKKLAALNAANFYICGLALTFSLIISMSGGRMDSIMMANIT